MQEKYDIEFIVPICDTELKYSKRIVDFKKYGFLNIKEKQILLTILPGEVFSNSLKDNWPDNITVQIKPGIGTSPSSKVYEYFANYDKNTIGLSRWIAKIDDDCINDVSQLVDDLDENFLCTDPVYAVTELCDIIHPVETELLKKIGFGHWFDTNKENKSMIIHHEWEANVISQNTLSRILNNPKAMELMRERAKIIHGPNDFCLACAARICKVYPAEAYFLSRKALVGNFSLFGGSVSHIHAISYDQNNLHYFTDLLEKDISEEDTDLTAQLIGKEYLYWGSSPKTIKLDENYKIKYITENSPSHLDCLWVVRNNQIEFLNHLGLPRVVFNPIDLNHIEGEVLQEKTTCFLRELKCQKYL